MVCRLLFVWVALVGLLGSVGWAQPAAIDGTPGGRTPPYVAGVVWAPPDTLARALGDLQAMHAAGVRAIRTRLIENDTLLRAADSLGLAFYQDLPVASLSAARLADTLAYARRTLDAALVRARRHPSARAFGLARLSDTSDPAACAYFDALARRVRASGLPTVQTYYLTGFVESDRCGATVDLVLLDARDLDPDELVARWRASQQAAVGLGSVGQAIRPGVSGGYRVPDSPTAQARYLENSLHALSVRRPAPAVVFVYRWRDAPYDVTSFSSDRTSHGLLTGDHTPRPAFEVLHGFYTGAQRVFAFDAGTAPPGQRLSPIVPLGWLLLLLLGILYTHTPAFQDLAQRYFLRHAIYLDTVRWGRGLEDWASVALAALLTGAAGLTGTIILRSLGRSDALELLTAVLTPGTQRVLGTLLAQPVLLLLLLASLYAFLLLFHVVWLMILAGPASRVRPAQAMALVLWARWAVLPLLLGAMALSSLPAGLFVARVAVALLLAWIALELWAVLRMLVDFAQVGRVPVGRALTLGLAVPLTLVGIAVGVLAWLAWPELTFFWHLAVRP